MYSMLNYTWLIVITIHSLLSTFFTCNDDQFQANIIFDWLHALLLFIDTCTCDLIVNILSLPSPPLPSPPIPSSFPNIPPDSSPPKSREPVDEKQRLVSATYVNYGPTTNNGLNEYQAREISHGKPCNGTTDMLRSTLEDGFKILFPNIHSNPVHQGLQTSAQTGSSSSNRFPSTDLPSDNTKNMTSEWPDLKTDKTNSQC